VEVVLLAFVKKTDKLKLMVLINKLEKTNIQGYRIYPSLTVRIEGVIKRHDAEDTYIP
jgi:hypothetical protein